MPDTDSIFELVNSTLKNLDTIIISKLQTWGKIVQLAIDEIDFFIDFKDNNNFILQPGSNPAYDFKLSTSSTIFSQIIKSEINPVDAVVSGEVAIDGSLIDALEFSEIVSNASF